jgi:hypothetical protein
MNNLQERGGALGPLFVTLCEEANAAWEALEEERELRRIADDRLVEERNRADAMLFEAITELADREEENAALIRYCHWLEQNCQVRPRASRRLPVSFLRNAYVTGRGRQPLDDQLQRLGDIREMQNIFDNLP